MTRPVIQYVPSRIETAYEVQGEGPPLVLIHGADGDRTMFASILPYLTGDFRCLTYDQRDTAATRTPPDAWTIADLADDAAALIEHAAPEGAHVLGTSFGGMIAQELAIRRPDLVRSLTLSAAFRKLAEAAALDGEAVRLREAGVTDPEARRGFAGYFFSPRTLAARPEAVDQMLALMSPRTVEQQVRRGQAAAAFDSTGRLGAIQAPTLVVGPADDRVISPAQSRLLADEIPDARLLMMPDTGHALTLEHPEAVARAVIDFVRGLGA